MVYMVKLYPWSTAHIDVFESKNMRRAPTLLAGFELSSKPAKSVEVSQSSRMSALSPV